MYKLEQCQAAAASHIRTGLWQHERNISEAW